MKATAIDAERRTVWADAGLTAAELTTAVAAHDLAIGFGDTGSVGIGGITVGGGVGYLVRKWDPPGTAWRRSSAAMTRRISSDATRTSLRLRQERGSTSGSADPHVRTPRRPSIRGSGQP
jgi:hypothetical protein